jgi:hypothetical protein
LIEIFSKRGKELRNLEYNFYQKKRRALKEKYKKLLRD